MPRIFYPLLILLIMPLASIAIERVDPMRPDDQSAAKERLPGKSTATKKPAHLNLWLQSIQLGDTERTATINGKLLKVGDRIGGARVVAIEHNRVKLRRGREQINLMFLPRIIKDVYAPNDKK